jgi:hypothetical protein
MLLFVLGAMVTLFVGFIAALQSDTAATSNSLPPPPAPVVIVFICLFGAVMLYSLLFSLLQPAILAEYAQRGTLRSCFDFRALWRFIGQNPGEYLLLWLTEAVVGLIISLPLFFVILVIAFIPFVGPLLLPVIAGAVGFYLFLVRGHLVGQLLRARASATV